MKKSLLRFLPAFLFLSLFIQPLAARIIRVPADQPTIGEAIRASAKGDTVEVSPGEYFENLNFGGREIVLTSLWYLKQDTSYIRTTIINGSRPVHPDTASCVIISHGEGPGAVLQGFTLTGGKGTKWRDIHNRMVYREGGGILIELSSPVIRFNIIAYNQATSATGVQSAGGGGIRIGDGNPQILNNIVAHNQGKYGAGIVLNYTGATIRNNIIAYNTGSSQYYGGAGIWTYNVHGTDERTIENNTIAFNEATTGTGGVLAYSCSLKLRNNIIWGNKPESRQTYLAEGGTIQSAFCDIQNGTQGNGNLTEDPSFGADNFLLSGFSPCIDSGDSTVTFNDPEDPGHTGWARFPSGGTVRNDMGAYGGPGASLTGYLRSGSSTGITGRAVPEGDELFQNYPNPATGLTTIGFRTDAPGEVNFRLTDAAGRIVRYPEHLLCGTGLHRITIDVSGMDAGIYFYCMETSGKRIVRRMTVAR